jgi:hypothetical protein
MIRGHEQFGRTTTRSRTPPPALDFGQQAREALQGGR